jgi:hypothetical protein
MILLLVLSIVIKWLLLTSSILRVDMRRDYCGEKRPATALGRAAVQTLTNGDSDVA